jgi:hypothetical protein
MELRLRRPTSGSAQGRAGRGRGPRPRGRASRSAASPSRRVRKLKVGTYLVERGPAFSPTTHQVLSSERREARTNRRSRIAITPVRACRQMGQSRGPFLRFFRRRSRPRPPSQVRGTTKPMPAEAMTSIRRGPRPERCPESQVPRSVVLRWWEGLP